MNVRVEFLRPRICSGLTLVELMVSLALGLLIVLVTTGLLLSTRTGYLAQDDEAQLQEGGRFALEVVGRALRQAAYEHWDADTSPVLSEDSMSASILGLDARRLSASSPGVEKPIAGKSVVNGSDVLAVRFFGSGASGAAEGAMLNCAGYAVPPPTSQEKAGDERGWSIFYVGTADSGERVLYCKFLGQGSEGKPSTWRAESLVSGVESFQVLYGMDLDGDGIPDRYMRAGAVDELDAALTLEGADAAAKSVDLNRRTYWKRVAAVRIALLMRGSHVTRADVADQSYHLFGQEYSDAFADQDPGVHLNEGDFPVAERSRARRVFSGTVHLRNASAGSAI
ncbi:MAG TPA: PilW family protein [Noviherbaspirillum sp.]